MANDPNKQRMVTYEAVRTAMLAEEAKANGTADGRILIRYRNGMYVTYENPYRVQFPQRGKMTATANECNAFDFGLIVAAKAEARRLPSKLNGCTIINADTGEAIEGEDPEDGQESGPPVKRVKRISFSSEVRKEVYRKTEGHCYLCGDFIDFDEYEIEHKIPLAKGGTNEMSNLFCSCHKCNAMKGVIAPADLFEQVEKIYLYQVKKACGDDKAKFNTIKASLDMVELPAN